MTTYTVTYRPPLTGALVVVTVTCEPSRDRSDFAAGRARRILREAGFPDMTRPVAVQRHDETIEGSEQ